MKIYFWKFQLSTLHNLFLENLGFLIFIAIMAGLEPAIFGLEVRHLIH